MNEHLDNSIDLDISWRFVIGKVIATQSEILHLAIDVKDHPNIEIARLEIDSNNPAEYKNNSSVNLFLLNEVHNKPELWYAVSGAMADPDQNPWQKDAFSEGDCFEGQVINYVGDDAAIIDLNCNLTRNLDWSAYHGFTGLLHRLATPDEIINNISRILHIGDTVQVMLAGSRGLPAIDRQRLHLLLDVNQVLALREQQELKNAEWNSPIAKYKPTTTKVTASNPVRSEKKLLLIENDIEFCKAWQKLLKHWNVSVRYCLKPDKVRKELDENHFDGCLLDCDLGLTQQEYQSIEKQLEKTVQQTGMKLLRITGNPELVQQDPQQILEKPLRIEQLLNWLDTGALPKNRHNQRILYQGKAGRWRATGIETRVAKRLQQFLKDCCQTYNINQALLVKAERPGFFTVRASYNISEAEYRPLEREFQNTLIATAINTQQEQDASLSQCGPLQKFMESKKSNCLWVYPLTTDDKADSALVFFSSQRLDKSNKQAISEPRHNRHWDDLLLWLEDSKQLEAREVFATQGRLLSSTLHEIRTAASTLAGNTELLTDFLKYPEINRSDIELRDNLLDLSKNTTRLLELCENGLDHIRPEQSRIDDIAELLNETIKQIRGRIKAEGVFANIIPLNSRLTESISLPYPPKYVEIPLINLLDNAFHHCHRRSWAEVRVSLDIDAKTPELPIIIRVKDDGFGMTQAQVQKLFIARETGRGTVGTGMGLYLSKQMLESIGGQIELEWCKRWIGSSFIIRLPLEN